MAIHLRLPDEQLRDLAVVAATDQKTIQRLIEDLRKIPDPPFDPKNLLPVIGESVGKENAPIFLRILMSLYSLRRQRNLQPSEVLAGVDYAINQRGSDRNDWTELRKQVWRELGELRLELLTLDSLVFVVKAIDLAFEHTNLLQSAKIITDIRPIFDHGDNNIMGAVISHTLRIRYDSASGDNSISIAMDEADVRSLLEACTRAIAKAATAKQHLEAPHSIRVTIPGEDSNDD